MPKAIVVSGAETLSNEVRRDLIESVFADSQTMVLGAIITIISGLIIAKSLSGEYLNHWNRL